MSWMQKLYETYEKTQAMEDLPLEYRPVPPGHTTQQAHIEITIDENGNFKRASIVQKEETLIPATELSAGRTSGCAPYPLCDKIQYVAGDYQRYGGTKKPYFDDYGSGVDKKAGYYSLLTQWCTHCRNPKLLSVHKYVGKRNVIADLIKADILQTEEKGLLAITPQEIGASEVFKFIQKKEERNGRATQDQGDLFVRWCVEIPGERESRVWKDTDLINSWIEFNANNQEKKSFCYVTGNVIPIGSNHPAKIRHSGDKAKLLSSNDNSGYTFRGRFTDSEQACAVGYEITQKAHAALRWLIKRQSFRNEDQVIVSWEINGNELPPILENSFDSFFNEATPDSSSAYTGDIGEEYARRLSKKIAGYRETLEHRSDTVVMGLDSSTPGRMAITYYRELMGSELLDRIESWHSLYAWPQHYAKDMHFVGAPSPKDIAAAAFGRRIDNKISKATVSRILPCIVDGLPLPNDLILSVCKRAANRAGLEHWDWIKILGIACGLYKGSHKERGYMMALENDRNTRDYLYGRLLAVAERIEQVALSIAGETRDTNAARHMQRFSERPCSTWLQIEQAIVPYMTRLQSRRSGFLNKMKKLEDEIHVKFQPGDYEKDIPLTGEFLLGYHCQRFNLTNQSNAEKEYDNNTQEGE